MRDFNRRTFVFLQSLGTDTRKPTNVRKTRTVRPALEPLESIALPSTIPAHHMAIHQNARAHNVVKTVGIQSILPINYRITGVRQDLGDNVVLTGRTGPPSMTDDTPAFLYDGPLNQIPSDTTASSLSILTPEPANSAISGRIRSIIGLRS